MTLFTIGFSGKDARTFFETLRKAGVRSLIDIRLNNTSQLSGYTKKSDLEYFLEKTAGIGYVHATDFAPSEELFEAYKKRKGSWEEFGRAYLALLEERKAGAVLGAAELDRACLLCSEAEPGRCHRSLAAAYLRRLHPGLQIVDL